jgi:hypothetical protein
VRSSSRFEVLALADFDFDILVLNKVDSCQSSQNMAFSTFPLLGTTPTLEVLHIIQDYPIVKYDAE